MVTVARRHHATTPISHNFRCHDQNTFFPSAVDYSKHALDVPLLKWYTQALVALTSMASFGLQSESDVI
jgi:hypothetical protein